MKRFLMVFLIVLTAGVFGFTGQAYSWTLFPKKENQIDKDITALMIQQEKYTDKLFKDMNTSFAREINSFDRQFFKDRAFLNDIQAVTFFNDVESSLEKGVIPRNNGVMTIAYSKYVNINGKVSGVNYKYDSDGKDVTLIKSTDHNGKIDRAVYRYDIKGRKLMVKEFEGKTLVEENTQKFA